MSCKELLGLKDLDISEEELLDKLNEAKRSRQASITLKGKEGKPIEITLKQAAYFECGIMDGLA